MSHRHAYPVESAWRAAVHAVRGARPSVFLTGLVGPIFFWLLAAADAHFSRASMVQAAVPLPVLLALGIASTVNHIRLKKRRADLGLTRWTALISASLASLYLFTLSGYLLQLSLVTATSELYSLVLSPWSLGLIVGLYAFSALAAIVWSPRSVPTSKADDDQAMERNASWLPWILGAQASAVGMGVFLSMLSARGKLAGEWLWLVGVGTLGAAFMVFFGIVMFYRFIFLALHPIPPEVKEEFGLRP